MGLSGKFLLASSGFSFEKKEKHTKVLQMKQYHHRAFILNIRELRQRAHVTTQVLCWKLTNSRWNKMIKISGELQTTLLCILDKNFWAPLSCHKEKHFLKKDKFP